MKLLLFAFLFCFCTVFTQAQKKEKEKITPVNGWELQEKLPTEDVRQFRKDKLKEFKEEQEKYFNVPQGKWYFGVRGGYGVPIFTVNRRNIEDYLGVSDYFETEAGEISERTVVTNDGGGWKAAVYAGYQFNQFVSAELDVSFSNGKETLQGRVESPLYSSELLTRGRAISINPQIVLSTPNLGNFKMFGKFGMYLPAWIDAKGTGVVNDRNGTFIKSIASGGDANLLTAVDDIAGLLGENIDGLGFLEDGFFNAVGYNFRYSADADIDFRIDKNAIGFSASLGVLYQVSPLVGILIEGRAAGYSITTRSYTLTNINGELDLFGNRNILRINDNGLFVTDGTEIPAEELQFLTNINYLYKIDQDDNNQDLNPNTFDPSQPEDRLALRRSVYDVSLNISLQFNFPSKKNK